MDFDKIADENRLRDLRRILKDDSVIIDVGAHKGEFSNSLRSITRGKIYAFEPIPEAFEDLKKNISDSNFKGVNKAVSETDGKAEFHVMKSFLGSSFLPAVPNQESTWLQETDIIEVSTIRIDTFMDEQKVTNISLLKTDAEGKDLEVLKSAGKYLSPKYINAILVEISFHEFHKGQDSYYEIMRLVSQSGYFLAGFYPHFNRKNWLWWADVLFLPNNTQFSTNL